MGEQYKQLQFRDRLKIEARLNIGYKPKQIAADLGVHVSTIYREVKRGTYTHMNSDLTTDIRYSPEIAEARYQESLSAKGAPLKIGKNHAVAAFIEDKIINDDYSPAAVCALLHREEFAHFGMTFCRATLYKYIDEGVFLELTNADLPEKGFTPFLDSLMRNGLTFKRMYANGSRSIQAMPSVLGSIPSFRTPFVLMPQSLGESRQLPAMLADKGYATAFFCGSERGSMGFGAYARSAGVERLVSREDYEAKHGTRDFDGYWGIWDEEFLQFTGEELTAMPEPFFAALFTLSSHHPFVVPEKYAATLPEGYTRIHKGVAYDDRAFRLFFQRFGGEEWFRRTIFVFVADHVSSEKFAEETRSYPGNMHIIGFIYTPDGALRGEVGEITQQLDIMPTLLGLTGNREPYFAFGRDVLNEPQRPRWSVSYDGRFRALTGEGAIVLDDSDMNVQECPATPAADSLAQNFRALVQQYYTHIEKKSYTAND